MTNVIDNCITFLDDGDTNESTRDPQLLFILALRIKYLEFLCPDTSDSSVPINSSSPIFSHRRDTRGVRVRVIGIARGCIRGTGRLRGLKKTWRRNFTCPGEWKVKETNCS